MGENGVMQPTLNAQPLVGWLGNRTAFGLLTALLALLLALAWFATERVGAERELAEARRDTRDRLAAVHARLVTLVNSSLQGATGLVSLIHLDPTLDQAEFERAAGPVLAANPQLRNIAAAPDMVIALMAPLKGNEAAIGLDYRKTPSQFAAADWARISRQTVLAGPLQLVQGGTALIARMPVFLPLPDGQEKFWGLVSAVLDVERLYLDSGLLDTDLPIEVAIRGRNATGPAGELFFGNPAVLTDSPVLMEVELPSGSWQLAARPGHGWPTQAAGIWTLRAVLAAVVLVVFGALTLLLRTMRATSIAHAETRSAQRQVAALIEAAPDAMIIVNEAGDIVLVNAQAEKVFGWTRAELLGQNVERLLPQRHRHNHTGLRNGYFGTTAARAMRPAIDVTALRKDGTEFPVEISLSPLDTESGPVVCSSIRDVSERHETEDRARRSERRASAIADNLPALIAQLDNEQRFVFANATYFDWYGIDPKTMIGRTVGDVFGDGRHARLREHVAEVLASGKRTTFEERDPDRYVSATYVPEVTDDGAVCGLFVLALDISELKAIEVRLQNLARFDHLTGLQNRRSFEEELHKAIARSRRSGTAMGLMFIDIDHFKRINDNHGHAAGDAVLQAFATRLDEAVRTTDTVARLGGDEFVVILEPLPGIDAADTIARKIMSSIRPPIRLPQGEVQVTASIGVGLISGEDKVRAETLLATADAALYAAKQAGRNTAMTRHVPPQG